MRFFLIPLKIWEWKKDVIKKLILIVKLLHTKFPHNQCDSSWSHPSIDLVICHLTLINHYIWYNETTDIYLMNILSVKTHSYNVLFEYIIVFLIFAHIQLVRITTIFKCTHNSFDYIIYIYIFFPRTADRVFYSFYSNRLVPRTGSLCFLIKLEIGFHRLPSLDVIVRI